ncbi:MAG TPA: biotin synthase BioB [Planctomycetes bacterium]|nr:biotin synthase BioB [Planctomycetota bacterium]
MTLNPSLDGSARCNWQALADRVLDGLPIDRDDALAILCSADDQLLDLLSASFRIRFKWFGKTVQLYFLMNAKSGLCAEDCGYCSQSKTSTAEIPKYNLLDRNALLRGAQAAAQHKAGTYCIVISGRSPTDRELQAVERLVPEIKAQFKLKICACLGLLDNEQAARLKAAGVDRVNHNLNTSRSFYDEICSTHTYQDRIDTLRAVRDSGMELCSGGIIGMGEEAAQVVEMAFALRDLNVQSIPLNFLNSIDGTSLEKTALLTPSYCLKALAMFRFVNPDRELRIAGGRELHLGSLQPLGLYPANSIFIGDYLTTKGQASEADYQMIKDLGFELLEHRELATTSH